jgi:hypothetical protein
MGKPGLNEGTINTMGTMNSMNLNALNDKNEKRMAKLGLAYQDYGLENT